MSDARPGPHDRPGPAPAPPTTPEPASADAPRQRFRRYLRAEVATVSDTRWYLDQSTKQFELDDEVRLAVEELVDHLGVLMQFEATYDEDLGASVWSSPGGVRLVVSVVGAAAVIARLGHVARLCGASSEREAEGAIVPATGLIVICGAPNRRRVEDAVRLRRDVDIRIVTLDALAMLAELVKSTRLSHAAAVRVLQPAAAIADTLIQALAVDPGRS